MKKNKLSFYLLVLSIYIVAFFAGLFIYSIFSHLGMFWATLLANITATLVVWLSGIILKNSSVYDPYWSIAPPVIVICWYVKRAAPFELMDILLLTAIMVWAIRLTYNWMKRFGGFGDQDWRYVYLKNKAPKLWFITNLGGINMMPTLIVYIALVPAYNIIFSKGNVNIWVFIGLALSLTATCLQLLSDAQMERHRKDGNGCITTGLWKYSRHPNYLGEVLFWWSIFIMQMGYSPNILNGAGALIMSLLFIFVSIPMMEQYLIEKYPDYAEYKIKVPMLLPIKFRNEKL